MVKGLGVLFILLGVFQLFGVFQYILLMNHGQEVELLLAAMEPYKNGKVLSLSNNVIIGVSIIGGLVKFIGGIFLYQHKVYAVGLLIFWLIFSLLYEFNAGLHLVKAPLILLLIGALLFAAKSVKKNIS